MISGTCSACDTLHVLFGGAIGAPKEAKVEKSLATGVKVKWKHDDLDKFKKQSRDRAKKAKKKFKFEFPTDQAGFFVYNWRQPPMSRTWNFMKLTEASGKNITCSAGMTGVSKKGYIDRAIRICESLHKADDAGEANEGEPAGDNADKAE